MATTFPSCVFLYDERQFPDAAQTKDDLMERVPPFEMSGNVVTIFSRWNGAVHYLNKLIVYYGATSLDFFAKDFHAVPSWKATEIGLEIKKMLSSIQQNPHLPQDMQINPNDSSCVLDGLSQSQVVLNPEFIDEDNLCCFRVAVFSFLKSAATLFKRAGSEGMAIGYFQFNS